MPVLLAPRCGSRGGNRGVVVGLRHLIGDVFSVPNRVVTVDDEHGALEETPLS
jgi:hypothetical protein